MLACPCKVSIIERSNSSACMWDFSGMFKSLENPENVSF